MLRFLEGETEAGMRPSDIVRGEAPMWAIGEGHWVSCLEVHWSERWKLTVRLAGCQKTLWW